MKIDEVQYNNYIKYNNYCYILYDMVINTKPSIN